jgi:hypothetical protein
MENTKHENSYPTDVTGQFNVKNNVREFLVKCLTNNDNCILRNLSTQCRYEIYKNTGNGISFTKSGTDIVFYKTLGQIIEFESDSVSSIGSDKNESDNESDNEPDNEISHPSENDFYILHNKIDHVHTELKTLFYVMITINIINIALIGR